MSTKRFTMKGSMILENGEEITAWDCCELLNEQQDIIEAFKRENDKLYHWKSNDTLKEPVTYEAKEECSVELEKGVPL